MSKKPRYSKRLLATSCLLTSLNLSAATLFDADFTADANGFNYQDDTFRNTSEPKPATGKWDRKKGQLIVKIKNRKKNQTINGISGGWEKGFSLASAAAVTIDIRYRLSQSPQYAPDELSQFLVSIDGNLVGINPNDYIAQLEGDGKGGGNNSTGWQTVTLNLGQLAAGNHSVIIGSYNNKTDDRKEKTQLWIDQVTLNSDELPPQNQAPTISGTPATTLEADSSYSFMPTANDADAGDTLTFSIQNKPAWASFDSNSGTLSGTPLAANAGTAGNIIISVNDGTDSASLPAFDIVVAAATAPVVTLLGNSTISFEAGNNFTDAGATALDNFDGDLSANIVVTGTVDANTAGSYTLTYSATDAAGHTGTATRTVTVTAALAPVVTLLGNSTESFEAGGSYTEAGATAIDNIDGDLTANIVVTGSVDSNAAGTYTLTYTATDSTGLTGTATRTITVISALAPVVTLLGNSTESFEAGGSFTDAGATAADNVDGDLTANIVVTGSVDNNAAGTYSLTYTATDATGHTGTATRTVTVVAAEAPVVTLLGGNPLLIEVNTPFTDPGATALDNVDGDITASISVTGSVDNTTAGDYTLTYSVTDAAGHTSTATRTVTVGLAPAITGTPKAVTHVYEAYHFVPQIDNAGSVVTFSVNNLPTWASFDTATGILSGQPAESDIGTSTNIQISVLSDSLSADLAPFSIEVAAAVNLAHKFGIAIQPDENNFQYYRAPELAIDGDLETSNHTQCTSAENWWQVELPLGTKVTKVVVHNHDFGSRLNGAKIYIGSDSYTGTVIDANHVDTLTGTTAAQVFDYDPLQEGRYLMIKADVANCLHMLEVEVYGEVTPTPQFLNADTTVTIDKWHNKTESILQITAVDYQNDTLDYAIEGTAPFSIDANGHIQVNDVLSAGDYTFDVVISDGLNSNRQTIVVTVGETVTVAEPVLTNDNQPALTGYLPNTYTPGDSVAVEIDGMIYQATVYSDGTWALADDVIAAPLAVGSHDLTLTVNGEEILYPGYFEVYASMLQSSDHSLFLDTIADVAITINSYTLHPLVKGEKVRGSSISFKEDAGQILLENKSYREIKSLLGQYTDVNGDNVFVKLEFNETIKPYSLNVLSAFANDAQMKIVQTAGHFDMKISFGGEDCNASTDASVVHYCVPTPVQDSFSGKTANADEQTVYSIATATYHHLYNSIDGLNAMHAWVEQGMYKDIDYTGSYQAAVGYMGDTEPMTFLYKRFFGATMPNNNVEFRSMRYKYAAEGMGGGGKGSLFGDKNGGGWASSWEGAIKFDGHRLLTYDTIHHEMMHAIGYPHSSGITYGWSYALKATIDRFYTVGQNPIVHVPKYIFETKYIENNKLQITVHKTSEAAGDDVTFEILSSTGLIDNDYIIEADLNDGDNQVTLSSDETIMARLFLRLHGADSEEIMSQVITLADFTQTHLVTDPSTETKYHVINHADWAKTAAFLNKPLDPQNAPSICKAWFGNTGWIAYKTDAELINTTFRSEVDNADWLSSKNFVGRIDDWWKYNSYDYSNGTYVTTWLTYNVEVTDATLGILCVE